MKKILESISLGIAIGFTISIIISLLRNDGNYYPTYQYSVMGELYYKNFNNVQIVLISGIIWASIGLFSYVVGNIFNHIKQSNILKITIIHYFILLGGILGFGFIGGWLSFNLVSILIFIAIFTTVYVIIYFYIRSKLTKEIDEINKSIAAR